jgi:uncharacterized protein (TIRG00374 family)
VGWGYAAGSEARAVADGRAVEVGHPRPWLRQIQLWGGLLLGGGLLAWFVASIDFAALTSVLWTVKVEWLALATVVMLLDYAVHGWRWKVLLRHVDPHLDWRTIGTATAVLWAFNTLLPLRAGNLLRPAVVASRRNLPYTTLLFTIVAESVCDVFGIVLMVLWLLRILPDGIADADDLATMRSCGTWGAFAALLGLGAIVLLSTRRARAFVFELLRPFPSQRLKRRALRGFDQLVQGMAAVGNPLRLVEALAITILVWVGWLVAIVCTLKAFGLNLPLAAALFMETALTLTMMVPQAPGFLGVFQVVTERALALFGAPTTESQAIALVFWTVCFVPITLIGLVAGYRAGLEPTHREAAFEQLEQRARSGTPLNDTVRR